MDDLKEKVVLITGAGRGSGRLLARAFAERGAYVAMNDISPVNVEQFVDEIIAKGGRAQAYIDDVAKKVGAQNIINQVVDEFERIDILINHAAVEPQVPLLDMDEWDWHRVLDVNLTGAFLMTQSVGRVMRLQGSGTILNLIATAARDGGTAPAFLASMAGLRGLTLQAAQELSPYGIKVHAIEVPSEDILETAFRLLGLAMEER